MGETFLQAIIEFFSYLFASRVEKAADRRAVLFSRATTVLFLVFVIFILVAGIYNNLN